MILESHPFPVMEQQDVNLRCRMKANESKLSADFFKDGRDIGNGLTGEMTISNISRSHEGRYKCRISGVGESAESWLTVTGETYEYYLLAQYYNLDFTVFMSVFLLD